MKTTADLIIKYLSENWTVIAGIGAMLAYIAEKLVSYYLENKKKKEAYHRVFTGTIKLYFNYNKAQLLYRESIITLPDEAYIFVAKYVDTFNSDILAFKKIIDEETEIIPEIALTTHALFDVVERLQVIDKISASGQLDVPITDKEKLIIRRAQFYALREFLEDFFREAIEEIRKRTFVGKKFTKRLFHFGSEQYQKEAIKEQLKIMRRYYESLHKQGIIPDEAYSVLINQLVPPPEV
jgi:hypothetical protein